MPTPTPVLETRRLLLRLPTPDDLEPWTAFATDEEVMRFLGGVQGRAGAWRSLATMIGAWTLNGFAMFSVVEKETGRWVGRLGPWQPAEWPGTEVGWGLAREAWGKGYAYEGSAASIDWAFAELGWTEVIHAISPENVNSSKLAERLGSRFLRKAVLPAPLNVEVDIWGQSRAEWEARPRA